MTCLDAVVAAVDEQIATRTGDTASASLLAELTAAKYWFEDYRNVFAAYAAEVRGMNKYEVGVLGNARPRPMAARQVAAGQSRVGAGSRGHGRGR